MDVFCLSPKPLVRFHAQKDIEIAWGSTTNSPISLSWKTNLHPLIHAGRNFNFDCLLFGVSAFSLALFTRMFVDRAGSTALGTGAGDR